VEVKFLTWTGDNLLRQVVYEGLREDKLAAGGAPRGAACEAIDASGGLTLLCAENLSVLIASACDFLQYAAHIFPMRAQPKRLGALDNRPAKGPLSNPNNGRSALAAGTHTDAGGPATADRNVRGSLRHQRAAVLWGRTPRDGEISNSTELGADPVHATEHER